MSARSESSFFARLRRWLFKSHVEQEIYGRICPHLRREKNSDYSFTTIDDMNRETASFEVQELQELVEGKIRNMPKTYAAAFRYVMQRDLRDRLRMYDGLARLHVKPAFVDPRHISRPVM
jgi:hypothetical protein